LNTIKTTIGIFLRKIGNFDLNPESEIIPISLTDSGIKVKCEGYIMYISLADDEKFTILSQYKDDEDLQRLPETEISKILNKN